MVYARRQVALPFKTRVSMDCSDPSKVSNRKPKLPNRVLVVPLGRNIIAPGGDEVQVQVQVQVSVVVRSVTLA